MNGWRSLSRHADRACAHSADKHPGPHRTPSTRPFPIPRLRRRVLWGRTTPSASSQCVRADGTGCSGGERPASRRKACSLT